jgi:hypothetical protein
MQSYAFRIRFRTPAGRGIAGAEPELTFDLPGAPHSLLIRKLPHKSNHVPGTPETFVLTGGGFQSEVAARECGNRLKRALAVYGVTSRLGVDTGRDNTTSATSQAIKDQYLKQYNVQLRDTIHGLDVYAELPPVQYLEISATGSLQFSAANAASELVKEFQRRTTFSPKLGLALEIYNLTFFEPATKIRFLSLVTVIEVLSNRKHQTKDIRGEIDKYIDLAQNSSLSLEEQEKLISGLGNLKRESISRACHRLVAESIGTESAAFFSNCYAARSQLLHDGETKWEVNDLLAQIDDIVREVLLWCIQQNNDGRNG